MLEKDGEPVAYHYPLTLVLRHAFGITEISKVAQGHTIQMNNCCVVAGSAYSLAVTDPGRDVAYINYGDLRPRLCNIHGIPFGFAVFDITGTIQRGTNNDWIYTNMHAHVVDSACPRE